MARPIKKGIDYFSFDVKFLRNIKVRKILKACGASSITVLISLLSRIYEDRGYYTEWNEDVSFLVSDEVGVSEGLVAEVVTKATQVEFFDKDKFKNYKILTSKGIQERYLEATVKRKSVVFNKEYLVIDINSIINLVNVNINSINAVDNTQRREEEIRGDKSKGDNASDEAEISDDKNKFADDSVEVKLSKYLYNQILKNKSNYKKPNFQAWAKSIDLLIRVDGENAERVKSVIDYATTDDFWKSVILSTHSLRKNFAQIDIQMSKSN